MDEATQKQIGILKGMNFDEADTYLLEEWETTLKHGSLMLNLATHPALQIIIEKFRTEIVSIDKSLHEDKTLFESRKNQLKGLVLHERKAWLKGFLRIFSAAGSQVEYVKKQISESYKEHVEDTKTTTP